MTENASKPNPSDEIDKNLRLVYESILNEELPDRFSKLLQELEAGKVEPRNGADLDKGEAQDE